MSVLYVTEYADIAKTQIPIGSIPVTATQNISFTATAGQSAAFQNNTKYVRLATDGVANVKFGVNPTAVTGVDMRLGVTSIGEIFDVSSVLGDGYKVSAVTAPA